MATDIIAIRKYDVVFILSIKLALNLLREITANYRTSYEFWTLSVTRCFAWNDLPPSLHCITDSKRFRKHLKTHYFNRPFVDTLLCMSGQLCITG